MSLSKNCTTHTCELISIFASMINILIETEKHFHIHLKIFIITFILKTFIMSIIRERQQSPIHCFASQLLVTFRIRTGKNQEQAIQFGSLSWMAGTQHFGLPRMCSSRNLAWKEDLGFSILRHRYSTLWFKYSTKCPLFCIPSFGNNAY